MSHPEIDLKVCPWTEHLSTVSNQVSPLHIHYVSALYTISTGHFCPALPLGEKQKTTVSYLSVPQLLEISLVFSVLKLTASAPVHLLAKAKMQYIQHHPHLLLAFLDGPWKLQGGVSSAQRQLGAKLLLESTEFSTWTTEIVLGKTFLSYCINLGGRSHEVIAGGQFDLQKMLHEGSHYTVFVHSLENGNFALLCKFRYHMLCFWTLCLVWDWIWDTFSDLQQPFTGERSATPWRHWDVEYKSWFCEV